MKQTTSLAPSSSSVRESWNSRVSFILACIGYAVGLGNIWRFPYLCYKSGGGAFLVPYLVMLVLCGLPLLFMELAVGQYTRRGPIQALAQLCPILKGAGVATVVISFWLCTYYNVIIAWALAYLVASFQSPLPWVGCNNTWNTEDCWDVSSETNETKQLTKEHSVSSTQEYYDHRILGMSSGIEEMGSLRWDLLGFLFLAWVVVYFCLWRSVRATGKVVYFTATVPYLLIFVFLGRGVSLPGATDGLMFLFQPEWDKMLDAKVWVYAASQVFNSIGIAFGSLIAFASYNPFHGPVLRDTLIVVVVDAATCILCGICVFSTLGNLALEQGRSVEDVVAAGPGLVFVAFPHALSKLPCPQLWSVVFFGMLFFLGIDSQFATVEVIITSLKDGYEDWIAKHLKRHEVLVALVCVVSFIFGIPYVFQGGIFYFQIVDYYAAALSLMYIAFFECIAIVWFYGTSRLASNVRDMTGNYPNWFFRACWLAVSPVLIMVIWISSIVDYKEPTYNNGSYTYPSWAIILGWCVAATSLAAIPGYALVQLIFVKADTVWERIRRSFSSTIKECPCGCQKVLDEKFEAHDDSSLIVGCSWRRKEEEEEEDQRNVS